MMQTQRQNKPIQERIIQPSKARLLPQKYRSKIRTLSQQLQSKDQKCQTDFNTPKKQKRTYSIQQTPKTNISRLRYVQTEQKKDLSRLETSQTNHKKNRSSNQKQFKIRYSYSRSQGKQEVQKEGTSPWGGPAIAKGISFKTTLKDKLEQERKSLQKLSQLRFSFRERNAISSMIKYKTNSPIHKSSGKLVKRFLPDYLDYIHGQGSYSLGFNFAFLRSMARQQAEEAINMEICKIQESIFLCMLDILKVQKETVQDATYKLLKQYSLLYFRLFQKVLAQFVLYFHVYKLLQTTFLRFLVHTRKCIFFLHQSASEKKSLTSKFRPLFITAINLIIAITKSLSEAHKDIGAKTTIIETFKLLKVSATVEKQFAELKCTIQVLQNMLLGKLRVKEWVKQFDLLLQPSALDGLQLEYLAQTECVWAWKMLRVPPIPYLPQTTSKSKPYTLILTLNLALMNYDSETRMVQFRPHLDRFLQKVSANFELVIWSDQEQTVDDIIIDSIEGENTFFAFRLYSDHLSIKNGVLTKDLSRLGRPTQRTLLLDIKKQPCQNKCDKKQPEKGTLLIPSFLGDINDKQLMRVLSRLQYMTEGLPQSVIDRQPMHLGTLEHIEEDIAENNNTISTHN